MRLTFSDHIKLALLPDSALVSVFDKVKEEVARSKHSTEWNLIVTMKHGGKNRSEYFLDTWIECLEDPMYGSDIAYVAFGVLAEIGSQSERYGQKARDAFMRVWINRSNRTLTNSSYAEAMDKVAFPIAPYIQGIKAAMLDKSRDTSDRDILITRVAQKIDGQSSAYSEFSTATLMIAFDQAEEGWLRSDAVSTLDPVKHKDFLWKLTSDPDQYVREEAFKVLNRRG